MPKVFKYLLTLSFLTYPVVASMKAYGDFTYYSGSSDNLDMDEMMNLLNQARQSTSMTKFSFDRRLACAAQSHCQRMAATKQFGHNIGNGEPSDRTSQCGFEWSSVRENIYSDDYGGKTQTAHYWWMISPEHYANIMAVDVDRVGIAVCDSDNKTYWVQVFGKEMTNTGTQHLVIPGVSGGQVNEQLLEQQPTLAQPAQTPTDPNTSEVHQPQQETGSDQQQPFPVAMMKGPESKTTKYSLSKPYSNKHKTPKYNKNTAQMKKPSNQNTQFVRYLKNRYLH